MRVLEATFRRASAMQDRIEVIRSNGSPLAWDFPTYGGTVPHDLIHLIVESAFGLRRGFWGRVDAGAGAHEIGAASRAPGAGARELLVAEALAATDWYDPDVSDLDRCDDISQNCRRFGVEPTETITQGRAALAADAARRLRRRARALAPPESIRLPFCAVDPAAGLVEIFARLA